MHFVTISAAETLRKAMPVSSATILGSVVFPFLGLAVKEFNKSEIMLIPKDNFI